MGTKHNLSAFERFISKVRKTDFCWIWTGAICGHGYGNFHAYGKYYRAHRFAYEYFVGKIGPNLDLDHLCRNRKCVNPRHLEPVSRQENLLRGDTIVAKQAQQTHCIHGHEFNDANTYHDSRGRRHCRKCKVIRQRKYRNGLRRT